MQNNYDSRGAYAGVTYAGFWVRLAAYLIDSVIVFLLLLAVRLVMSGVASALYGTVLGGNILFNYTLKDIVLYLGQVLYFILCTRYTGTTPGKRAMNLRVISVDESGQLDLLTVVYRETVGRFLCGIFVCIGYLVVGLDKEKRGFHDMLCDTRVVYGKKVRVYPAYGYAPMRPVEAPPVGTMPDGPGNGAGMPPVGNVPGSSGNGAGMSSAGMDGSGQTGSFGPVPPTLVNQSGPYRLVRPNEQNVHPAEVIPPVPPVLPGEEMRTGNGREESGAQTEEEKGDSDDL